MRSLRPTHLPTPTKVVTASNGIDNDLLTSFFDTDSKNST